MTPLLALLLLATAQMAERATSPGGALPGIKLTATGTFSDGTTRLFGVTADTDGDGVAEAMTLAVTCTGPTVSSAQLADGGITAMDDWESPVVRRLAPRDAASGLPTGKRMHKPVTMRADLAQQVLAKGSWNVKANTAARGAPTAAGKVSVSDLSVMKVSLSDINAAVCSLH